MVEMKFQNESNYVDPGAGVRGRKLESRIEKSEPDRKI